MRNDSITLKVLNNTSFPDLYEEFLLDINMTNEKYKKILSLAILFLNSSNQNINRLGYRIIVMYCNRKGDYKPLYDIAINSGIIPVAQFIEDKIMGLNTPKNIFTELNAVLNMKFIINNVYCTLQQRKLIDFYNENPNNSLSIVAPTSYGKTDLILNTVKNNTNKNICIITPTKSLLAQTKLRISQSFKDRNIRIITHPDMYNKNDFAVLAVMTQERVLRFLKKNKEFSFDYVIIDEAHGILRRDDRNLLLASVIMILSKRNPNTKFKFLTPFLADANNVKVRYTDYDLKPYVINEYIKTERLYLAELRDGKTKNVCLYDQFLNRFYEISKIDSCNELFFVKEYAGEKNVVYFNKPKDIESFVIEIIRNYKKIETQEIIKACENIAKYVHPKYRLIEAIKRGVIYHHGDVPEPIRMYIEKLYSEVNEIKYVITSSTLLEGVNLPAEKMFLLDNKKGQSNLSPSDFKNLIGRICRFSQIFHNQTGSLKKLEPEIYLVVGQYYSSNANIKKFIQETMNVEKKATDKLENVLLVNTVITPENEEDLKTAKEFIDNYEGDIFPNEDLRRVTTEAGQLCFMNNLKEIDIFEHEEIIQKSIENFRKRGKLIARSEDLLDIIYTLFFSQSNDESIQRFKYDETKSFYKMFLDWRINNTSLNQMIYSFLKYWKGLLSDGTKETFVYVGRWGDVIRGGVRPLWTDIRYKSDEELINLAIVRIKEEQDYLDNVLIKYVEVLNDLKLLDEKLYLLIKYGTDDNRIITCTRNGISLSLAKILIDQYAEYINVDCNNDTVLFRKDIIDRMKEQGENEVLLCELSYFL